MNHFFRAPAGYLILPLFIALCTFLMLNISNSGSDKLHANTINAVLGDKSYVDKYGLLPQDEVPDSVRIRVHLTYVEELLRQRPTDHLTAEQKKNRTKYLDLLREYRMAGNFPHNDGHPDERRPTFIDKDGNICAVGYLVEQSLGRDVAKKLNVDYKYAYIQQINHPIFKKWAKSSGFTLEELAMIQPMYGGSDQTVRKDGNNNKIGVVYGTASLLTNAANGIYWSNSNKNPWLFKSNRNFHWYGLATGAGSIVLGSLNLDNRRVRDNFIVCFDFCSFGAIKIIQSNHARTAVSAFNIAAGTATALRAAYHLIRNSGAKGDKQDLSIPIQFGELQTISNRGVVQPTPVLTFSVSF